VFNEPLGYFITWVTYGAWLPGDSRGWVEYHRGWKFPDPVRQLEAAISMTEDACRLDQQQRDQVEKQVKETCARRQWKLHAVNCRSNHCHAVVSAAGTTPRKIRSDLKAWATRRLKQIDSTGRENWWAERGSIRFIYDHEGIAAAGEYVLDGQDWKERNEKQSR